MLLPVAVLSIPHLLPTQAHMGRDMAGYLSSNGFKAMIEPLASQQDNEKVQCACVWRSGDMGCEPCVWRSGDMGCEPCVWRSGDMGCEPCVWKSGDMGCEPCWF